MALGLHWERLLFMRGEARMKVTDYPGRPGSPALAAQPGKRAVAAGE